MGTLFTEKTAANRMEIIAHSLEMQTEIYGAVDVPLLQDKLVREGARDVLDVGIGDGSFLMKLAEATPEIRYLGLEQNEELIAFAKRRFQKKYMPNVALKCANFDSGYTRVHDAVLARFTLQHVDQPDDFLDGVLKALKPGGVFLCLEPIYDYYDCGEEDKVWRMFRERMLAVYAKWGSLPNVPKSAAKMFSKAGFREINVSVNLLSPATIGRESFSRAVSITARTLHFTCPEVWDQAAVQEVENWLAGMTSDPYLAIAHIHAEK